MGPQALSEQRRTGLAGKRAVCVGGTRTPDQPSEEDQQEAAERRQEVCSSGTI